MGKTELYQMIQDYTGENNMALYTILEGEYKGKKILISGTKVLWKSEELESVPWKVEKQEDVLGFLETSNIFKEEIEGEKQLVICGAGHVSLPIIEMAKKIGFYVTVIEDRPTFADHARKAGADMVVCEEFEKALLDIEGGADTYFVIVTRGHRYDRDCLKCILRKPHAYVGMMGSKRRIKIVKEQLEEEGYEKTCLEDLHAPIGLDIGAETPEEIAVSILAEIIQIKSKNKKTGYYDKEILRALLEENRNKILATIIARKGSAPRSVGTKMVVYRDGQTVGTIGGGCMEFEVVQRARMMLEEKQMESTCIEVDMTTEDAEDAGMVCGGKMKVLLEP